MSFAMEPMKVPLRLNGATAGFHVLGNCSPVLEVQINNAELAYHKALVVHQNAILMRHVQQWEKASQAVQVSQSLVGPPGLFIEPSQPLPLAMAGPPGLTKELVSNHSDASTTCTSCDEVSSTHSDTQVGDVKPLTQVVIKHLRSDLTRAKFLDFLHVAGYGGKCDMVYLPINFETGKCCQYAFVNFVSEEIGQQFLMQFQGSADEIFGQEQCDVSWSDRQGLPDIIEKYRNSPIMHPDVPENYKPVLFKHGQPIPFPAPTRHLKRPKGLPKQVVNQNLEEAHSTANNWMSQCGMAS